MRVKNQNSAADREKLPSPAVRIHTKPDSPPHWAYTTEKALKTMMAVQFEYILRLVHEAKHDGSIRLYPVFLGCTVHEVNTVCGSN